MDGRSWFAYRDAGNPTVPRCRAAMALALGLASFLVLAAAGPAAAQFPLDSCLNDVQGANDVGPEQKDLTRYCAEAGTGLFEVFVSWNWDKVAFPGNNTGDGCSLYDSDNDGLANFAVCVTIGGDLAVWQSTSLYSCDDTQPNRCSTPAPLTPPGGGFKTTCTALQSNTDPFSAGEAYPADTEARCQIDTNDFGGGGLSARLLDVCSSPSGQPNSAPEDCVVAANLQCDTNSDCDDGNVCTNDICNEVSNFCTHTPVTSQTSCEDQAFCTTGDTCNLQTGLCDPGSPRDCSDSNSCTSDSCNEELDQCTHSAVANGTSCGSGPIDLCDAQDVCVDGSCVDALVAPGNLCRASAGLCDLPDYCTGASKACPNQLQAQGTECRGSAGICDVAEACTGSSALCPVDGFQPSTYVCRAAGGECGAEELCTGSGPTCPADAQAPAGTPCGDPSDEGCNAPDTCNGEGTCVNNIEEPGEECRAAASDCDIAEVCTAEGTCPDDVFKDEGSACGNPDDNVCTDPDTCDGSGLCLPNNTACGWITDSSLCEFDVAPGDTCVPDTKQFRLLFTPDAEHWIAYKLTASNPGQFYYNAFIDGDGGEVVPTTIQVPWPFVTQGANPVHVYDGNLVGSSETGPFCLLPPYEALAAYPATITLGDRIDGTSKSGAGYSVYCPPVTFNPADPSMAFCQVALWVTIPPSGLAYVNMHLDYGPKGPHTDMNPADGAEDRYDKDGGSNALVNTPDNNGDLAIAQCSEYPFSHDVEGVFFGDTVYNVNDFKKVAGVYGLVSNASTTTGILGATVTLLRGGTQVATAQTDEDGYYLMSYKHTGKSALYTVRLDGYNMTKQVELKANGLAEVNFEVVPITTTASVGGGR